MEEKEQVQHVSSQVIQGFAKTSLTVHALLLFSSHIDNQHRVLLGLDDAGKTSLLHSLEQQAGGTKANLDQGLCAPAPTLKPQVTQTNVVNTSHNTKKRLTEEAFFSPS